MPEVRLIDEEGTQVGVVATSEALANAEGKGLDLVEVAPQARPPVCRIMDFGKYIYEQRKRQRDVRKGQSVSIVKEIKISAKIEEHDINFKISHIREFLARRHRVKVTVVFRGREISHSDLGLKVLRQVIAELDGVALVENEPRLEGRTMSMLLAPAKKAIGSKAKTGPAAIEKETHA